MGQLTSPLLTFVVDKELLDKLDHFRSEHRFRSRAEAIRWLLEWVLDNGATPEEKDCPPFCLCFRGMQGGEGPLPKGSVGGSQRTLEPCRGKDEKQARRTEERTSRNTRAAR